MHDQRLPEELKRQWLAGEALVAGQRVLRGVPRTRLPQWASAVLSHCLLFTKGTPREVYDVESIARCPERWTEAQRAFRSVRKLVLDAEAGGVVPSELVLGILYLAENVAKVAYNASDPERPFDEDSAYWIFANVHWLASRLGAPSALDEAWQKLSDVSCEDDL